MRLRPPTKGDLHSPDQGLVRLPGAALGRPGTPTIFDLLDRGLAVHFSSVLAPPECAAWASQVRAARAEWTPNFEGIQFTLGRAFYAHLEQDSEDDYFDEAAASDAVVQRAVPGLQERLLGILSALVAGPVLQRPGWCGAGVHIFPTGGECARRGGDLHYDNEGLTEEQLAARAPALTLVLMIQSPESGGGLRVWDKLFEGQEFVRPEEVPARSVLCSYHPGDLVVIDSYRLHQIMPFSGMSDRISATLHGVHAGEDDAWHAWF